MKTLCQEAMAPDYEQSLKEVRVTK